LPLKSKVIYGMVAENGISERRDTAMQSIDESSDNVEIYYSNIPVHAKSYIWKKNREVVYALVGSANFSSRALCTPHREILAECTQDCFPGLNEYWNLVLENSIRCTGDHPTLVQDFALTNVDTVEGQNEMLCCTLTLLDRNGEIQEAAGLNWGQHSGSNNTRPNDAYIPIRKQHIRDHPQLFPSKRKYPQDTSFGHRMNRHNDKVEIIWDDGKCMEALLEGTQEEGGMKYPKQISSFPEKENMGIYLRNRLNVELGSACTKDDLLRYGRTDVSVTMQDDGIYLFDFSKPK
jgi:hypothetical protein